MKTTINKRNIYTANHNQENGNNKTTIQGCRAVRKAIRDGERGRPGRTKRR